MNIWHELDHPTRPLTHENVADILDGVQAGIEVAPPSPFWGLGDEYVHSVSASLQERLSGDSPEPSPEFFIGQTIGVRAAILELDTSKINGSGFQVATHQDINALRGSKAQGTHLEKQYASADFSFGQMLRAGIQEKQGTEVMAQQPASAVIGLAIGLRYAALSPPEGVQEREAA